MIIRKACLLDIDKILVLAKKYYDSIEKIPYEFHAPTIAATLQECLPRPDNGFFVAIDKGELVGLLWGMAMPVLPWTPTVSAIDILFFVREDYRGTRTSNKLIKTYEAWAKQRGCVECLLGTSSGINTERTIRFYERLGYSLTGQQLTKDL